MGKPCKEQDNEQSNEQNSIEVQNYDDKKDKDGKGGAAWMTGLANILSASAEVTDSVNNVINGNPNTQQPVNNNNGGNSPNTNPNNKPKMGLIIGGVTAAAAATGLVVFLANKNK